MLINTNHLVGGRISLIMRRRSWEHFQLWMKAIRNFIVDLGIIAVVLGIIVLVVWESFREVIVIEPIEMPKRFVDAGYTPHVVASQLMGNLLRIYGIAKTTHPTLVISTVRPDIVIPGTGYTIRTITGYFLSILRDPTTRISGEVTEQNGTLKFHLRIHGRHVDIPESSPVGLDAWLTQIIQAVLRETDPYVLATYLFGTNREASRKEVLQIIATAPEKSELKAQAYNLYGMILSDDQKFDEAIDKFNESLSINRRAPYVFLNLGNVLYQTGAHEEAIKNIRKAIELDPRFAVAYSNLGVYLLHVEGARDEAIENLRKAIELAPKEWVAYSNLGEALRTEGKHDEAIKNLRKAIELAPKDGVAYSNLGNALRAEGKHDEAIQSYRKAIDLNPKYVPAYNGLGNTLSQQGKHIEVIQNYHKAIELDPKNAIVYSNLGNALSQQGKHDEAIQNYHKAIDLNPEYASAYNGLGNALSQTGAHEEAIKNLRKAIELAPKDGVAYGNLGNALFRQGAHEEAIQNYRKATELDPKNADAYSNLGLVSEEIADSLRRAGKPNEAEDKLAEACIFFHQASILTPNNQSYRFRLDRINSLLPSEKKCVRE